jgi:hypothetical protein
VGGPRRAPGGRPQRPLRPLRGRRRRPGEAVIGGAEFSRPALRVGRRRRLRQPRRRPGARTGLEGPGAGAHLAGAGRHLPPRTERRPDRGARAPGPGRAAVARLPAADRRRPPPLARFFHEPGVPPHPTRLPAALALGRAGVGLPAVPGGPRPLHSHGLESWAPSGSRLCAPLSWH